MAIILADGFETGVALLSGTTHGDPQAATGRDGVGISMSAGTTTTMSKTFTSGSDQMYAHFGYLVMSAQFGLTSDVNKIFTILADTNSVSHITANIDATGHITVRRGNSTGTIIATATLTLSNAVWYSVEIGFLIADASGNITIKINGVEHINFTGDTRNAGTATRPDAISWGNRASGGIDDFLLLDTTTASNNTWPGEICIVGVRPAANGANSGLSGSDGNSTDNYLLVDEVVQNNSDYVLSTTATNLDTYDMSAVGKLGTVIAVQNLSRAAKSDSGAKSFKHVMKSNSGTYVKSSSVTLSTTWTVYPGPIWLTDGDGTSWTVTKVNAHEFGFEVA